MFKILASLVIGFLGTYYMYRGKKTQNIKMILWGVALAVLSYLPFAGGGDDDTTKAVLKAMIPGSTDQQQQQP
ncbi:MAG TPA: hypothetical protein VK859_17040 [bacterium]|jgi:hypothetical protein|nr:hypothetical protein [bacterium]